MLLSGISTSNTTRVHKTDWIDHRKITLENGHLRSLRHSTESTGAVAIVLLCTIQQNPDFHL